MTFRTATLADVEVLLEIATETFIDTYAQHNTPEDMALYLAEKLTVERLSIELSQAETTFVLGFDSGQLMAYTKLIVSELPQELVHAKGVEIERFYVRRRAHGQQFGSRMMAHCEALALSIGFDTIWLGVWEHNPKAIQFYDKMGYRRFGEHVFQLGTDSQTDYLLAKTLI